MSKYQFVWWPNWRDWTFCWGKSNPDSYLYQVYSYVVQIGPVEIRKWNK